MEFTLFPLLPGEIQDQIWDIAAYHQADSLPPHIHPIAPDPETRSLSSLDSSQPALRLRINHRSHVVFPGLLLICRRSRDAVERFSSIREKVDGGYGFVNKEKDILYFSDWPGYYWVLLKPHTFDASQYHSWDEAARQQFMHQLQGCQNIAFDVVTSPIYACSKEQILAWLDTFKSMKKLIVVFGMRSDYRLKQDMVFVILDEESFRAKGGGGENGRRFKEMVGKFKEAKEELGVEIPEIVPVYAVSMEERKGDGWARDLVVCAF